MNNASNYRHILLKLKVVPIVLVDASFTRQEYPGFLLMPWVQWLLVLFQSDQSAMRLGKVHSDLA